MNISLPPKLLLWLLLCMPLLGTAQQSFTLSGYVRDASTGESLIGASVFSKTLRVGTLTNEYGFYSLSFSQTDSAQITFAYAGFTPQVKTVKLTQDQRIDISLEDANATLEDVIITGEVTYEEEINSTQMSVNTLDIQDAKLLPALFGEVDILKTLQLKPGVQSGGEGTSGLYVRGGGPDQNLIVLDEAIVYNANHLFGLFSTFNSDAVKDVKLYKGGFPAQFGGRLSSVVDVRLKDGNRERFSGRGGIGTISSRLTLEGPFNKGKGSFIVAGRRTYFDIITRAINRGNEDKEDFTPIPDYYFYDLNTKINYELGENDRLFISGYFGKDVFGFNGDNFDFNFNWGNITTTLRWNHLFSSKLFLNTTFTFSDYDYVISNNFAETFRFELGSKIQDISGKMDFDFRPNNQHTIRFGASAIRHKFVVGRAEIDAADSTQNFSTGQTLFGQEFGVYFSDDFVVNDRLTLNGGVRLSGFQNEGKFYGGFEPRASAKYSVSDKVSLKAGVAAMSQYLHLVSSSGTSLPTDLWYPSTPKVKPQRATQVATGVTFQLGENFLISNEYYYKWLTNQIDFKDNANLFVNNKLEEEFIFGKGWAYGTEVYIQKRKGKLTGWIGYTLSWSWRQFDGSFVQEGEPGILDVINDGKKFHPRYDRRHDASVVAIYELSKKWSLTGAWVYGTGNATSLPTGRSFISDFGTLVSPIEGGGAFLELFGVDPRTVPIYPDRNIFRLPAYHRLDVGLVYKMFPKWGESDLTLSVYNAYNRRNAFFLYLDIDEDAQKIVAKQVALFPILPSITFNFKF